MPKSRKAKIRRCGWCGEDPLYQHYHDNEWGVPCFDDRTLFEFLLLEGAQAGLSWITILRKRENYRQAFDNFDPEKISSYNENKVNTLMNNAGIVRNRRKIEAAIGNAQSYLELRNSKNTLSDFLWSYADGEPLVNRFTELSQIPASTALSDQISKDMKKLGFKFFGSTICYAFMQACGIVNDHLTNCYCHPDNL